MQWKYYVLMYENEKKKDMLKLFQEGARDKGE
jgi:hypothetical protein